DPADGKAAEKSTAAEAKTEEPATSEKVAAEKSAPEKPAEKSAPAKSNAERSAAEQPATTTSSSSTDANSTLAKLHFADGINYLALDANLHSARAALGLPETLFDISSPDIEFTPGSGVSVKDWDVRISLPQDQAKTLLDSVKQKLADTPVFPTASTIGGKVAGDTKVTAYYALAVSTLLVAIYI